MRRTYWAAARPGSIMTVRPWPFLAFLTLLLVGYGATLSSHETGQVQAARVIDGDTLQVDGQTIQLYGIDAPELGQLCRSDENKWPCGVEAALALRKLLTVGDQKLQCSPWGGGAPKTTADGALIEVCQVGQEDLTEVMLRNGYGVATPGSFPDYAEAQKAAKEASLGIWHSKFQLPSAWRAANDDSGDPKGPLRDCNVKGVIDARGERYYYVPTDPSYEQIKIDRQRGERLFCSDEAARLAGWIRPPIEPVASR
jgi:endonuclease YncB( thermonuclease family)